MATSRLPCDVSTLVPGAEFPGVEVKLLRYELGATLAPEALEPLSAGERERAARFHVHADRVRFVGARLALREVLASKLGVSPATVPIVLGEHGKPLVAGAPWLWFSLAHSGKVGVIAVSTRHPVGVDVEQVDPVFGFRETAREVLTDAELASLGNDSDASARRRFYALWVRKEAVSKALGTGLTRRLRQFSVDPAAAEIENQRVTLAALDVGDGYSGALALLEPLAVRASAAGAAL
jgi:4'-phosphopantetheinyl transferase